MRRLFQALASLAASPLVLYYLFLARRRSHAWHQTPRPRLLLSFSQVLWDEVWQRPQEFAWRSAQALPVVYVSPVQVHRWLFTLGKRWSPVQFFRRGELVVLSPLVLSGHYKSELIFRLNCRIMAAVLRPWLTRAETISCVTNTPYALPVLRTLFSCDKRLRRIGYDVIDDFTAFEWSPSFGKPLDQKLTENADTVFTGTHELYEIRRETRPDVEFIPCGVDYELFSTPCEQLPADLAGIDGPILGYFGSISERLDLELLGKLARAFPEATLVLIGPVHLHKESLPREANIRYLGLKHHEDLAGYAQRFSVGLIPFRITEATVKLNPVKTLEYLAAGVPVVSTAIPDVERFFSSVVDVTATHEEFLECVGRSLQGPDKQRRQAGIAMARKASWERMCQRMLRLLRLLPAEESTAPAEAARQDEAN